ncbi:MAG: hypothetical protein NWR67_13500 [Saprospiraceae bacterium]|jgi:hypothetical protein|nr:hypothetical protein [Saprospiraceae bacterium]MDP4822021.1 hypothetical protein [Saprospiraceae bacterium]MDP4998391.1 hypothetical protein [Saprospiraceae bacterium]
MSILKDKIILLACCLLIGFSLMAQSSAIRPKINSPYSRFGLGNLLDQHFAMAGGMGGLGQTMVDPYHFNHVNPASLGFLVNTVFEVGTHVQWNEMREGDQLENYWSGNLNYMGLAMPLKNSINRTLDKDDSPWAFGMAFSLMPYSEVGYYMETTETHPVAGDVNNVLKGTGGTYKFRWGNAVRYKSLALGANLGYHFGKLTYNRRLVLQDLTARYDSELQDEFSINGFNLELGGQYALLFKKKTGSGTREASGKRLLVGVTYSNSYDINTNSSLFYFRDNFAYIDQDTVSFQKEISGEGVMPGTFGAGLSFETANKLKIGVEYTATRWTDYRNMAKPESLADASRMAFGLEYIPDYQSYNNYLKRVRYRFGGFLRTDPRTVDGDALQHYGLTLGFGLPVVLPRQQLSFINFAVEAGQFGLEDVLQENYVKIQVGFTLNDNTWFFKRKFN